MRINIIDRAECGLIIPRPLMPIKRNWPEPVGNKCPMPGCGRWLEDGLCDCGYDANDPPPEIFFPTIFPIIGN